VCACVAKMTHALLPLRNSNLQYACVQERECACVRVRVRVCVSRQDDSCTAALKSFKSQVCCA